MKTLADRLTEAMEECGKKPADLVRETGAKSSSVHNWVNGKTKNLKGTNLVVLARFLNVSEAWLADGVGPKQRKSEGWPFPKLNEAKVRALSRDDLIRLEAAIMFGAVQLGLDVMDDNDEERIAV